MADRYTFEISLSVLNHLGRNLYRSFVTVLGEAISNSWDADAENVWIYIDRENNSFVIKDDGCGMSSSEFQDRFLKVGYSKRKKGGLESPGKRPFIGAKGIGKLALLSCAQKISVITKTEKTEYIGGVIDNNGLNDAIKDELSPDEYPLGGVDMKIFAPYTKGHRKGTIIYFEQTKEDIRNTLSYLKKLIALYFRFSLIDQSFNIYLNDELITIDDLKDLADETEFVWIINNLEDPYIETLSQLKNEKILTGSDLKISGFIATVHKPRNLKITGTEEKVGVDLFVNGRLREKDILKHLPDFSTRFIASYLYGQIHYNELDKDGTDRFTTSREGLISGDSKYSNLIKNLKEKIFEAISDKWDELRLDRGEDGDDDNPRKNQKERRARSLYSLSAKEFGESENPEVKKWIKELQPDAEFNVPAYVDCYLSENLIRRYINEKSIPLTQPAIDEIDKWKPMEVQRKAEANISFDIRQNNDDLGYLGMDHLAKIVDGGFSQHNVNSLVRDSIDFKPMRNAVGHTSLLTAPAKQRLSLVFENIKARIKALLSAP